MFPNFSMGSGYGLPVPYQTNITPSLSPGTQIHVNGTPTGGRFEVNLKSHQGDIVLHFNPRVDERTVVLNTSQQGAWGTEERHSSPFHRGARFNMVITATDRGFSITVNNAHLCEFYQRMSMHTAQLVEVKGDITLEGVQVYSGGMGGSMGMGMGMGFPNMGVNVSFGQPPQSSFGGFSAGFGGPTAPPVVSTTFPMGGAGVPSIQSCRITTGSRIFVRGYIPPNANRFELNLLQGYNDSDDIAFHFNPRFDQRQIVKNHRRGGQWGSEENQPFPQYMPLMPGTQIDLQIACEPSRYTVYMNNVLIAEYHHKIPPGYVMALQYKGDITVTSVGQL